MFLLFILERMKSKIFIFIQKDDVNVQRKVIILCSAPPTLCSRQKEISRAVHRLA